MLTRLVIYRQCLLSFERPRCFLPSLLFSQRAFDAAMRGAARASVRRRILSRAPPAVPVPLDPRVDTSLDWAELLPCHMCAGLIPADAFGAHTLHCVRLHAPQIAQHAAAIVARATGQRLTAAAAQAAVQVLCVQRPAIIVQSSLDFLTRNKHRVPGLTS